jgi:hypothetical protein
LPGGWRLKSSLERIHPHRPGIMKKMGEVLFDSVLKLHQLSGDKSGDESG